MSWTPHATVACIIEEDNRFLMVIENDEGQIVINQPAGHVEEGETFEDAAIREALEETGFNVELDGLVGLYTLRAKNGATYHRLCYSAHRINQQAHPELDADIIETAWFTYNELIERKAQLRSPMVLACIDDYLDNRRFPLDFVRAL
jgi:ADP-ribose pyrophosphatase YjhB (NUDIX family)